MDDLVLQSGRKGHWGLPCMRERSESIGASLRLRSRIGAGTEVELTVPGTIAFESQPHGSITRWLSWFNREKFDTTASVERNRGTDERHSPNSNSLRRRSSTHERRDRSRHP